MILQQLITRFQITRFQITRFQITRSNPWRETVATVIYCGTEKLESWQTVVRYQYSFQTKKYEGAKLFSRKQNVYTQMDARLLADTLVRQYPIGSKHLVKVHKKKAWLSRLA